MHLLQSGKYFILLPFVLGSTILQGHWPSIIIALLILLILCQWLSYHKKITLLKKEILKNDSLSHEIRNPLAVISLSCHQLLRDESNQTKNINRIERAVEKIQRIIHRNNEAETISIDRFIAELFELTSPRIKKEQIDLKIEYQIKSPSLVAKVVPLQQVLINLINNSCDAIKNQQEKWISVKLAENENNIIFTVTDSGPGIPREYHQKMMNPYFSTKNRNGSKGLGLFICKEIINDHRGKFEFNANANNTQFIISLPKLVA